ncbi:MAG TPA: cation-translocating P-type ATPase [Acidimicrobiales bacterium]|nr:cation-translocating P-type ATPase [Acidimicrobiales bacterium]
MSATARTPILKSAWRHDGAFVAQHLGVDPVLGLSTAQAQLRLEHGGANEIPRAPGPSPARLLAHQFTNAMVVVLIIAAIVTTLTGETADTIVIAAIVVLNGVVGFVQEFRAQHALETLRRLEADHVTVRRDGRTQTVAASHLVAGDLVELVTGDVVPADLRLLEAHSLRVGEAALTGESASSFKEAEAIAAPGPLAIADQHNMAFSGTAVTYGHGLGVVVATGLDTELGLISDLLSAHSELPTPLQRRLSALARLMAIGAALACGAIFAIGLIRGVAVREMFITAVSLAVAAIPEGLPAIITVALALGARRMANRQALVRKLVAVETLGSVDVICTDKTGTLTQNQMIVERVWTPLGEYRISGEGYSPEGLCEPAPGEADSLLARLARASALCNDAKLQAPSAGGAWSVVGDPTEGALLAVAAKLGVDAEVAREQCPRVEEIPFDSERRRMTTVHACSGQRLVTTKGALESVAELVDDSAQVVLARAVAERWADEGSRVLALGERTGAVHDGELEHGLSLLGLVAITDPPRGEVAAALARCAHAGIATVMITGDHPVTAAAIATRLGLHVRPSQIMTGEELARTDDVTLDARVADVAIYARAAPADKIRIVRAWQRRGAVVAMTGDGVNDAPALSRADIGIAMGVTGTDVAKESADMVLGDDNFATIVDAVQEGRRIYDNIRRVVRYLLSTNAGELWAMFLAPIVGLPLPLLAVQILWMNLVTDGLPAIALGLEPVEPDAMQRRPRRRDESLLARGLGQHVVWVGLLMAAIVLVMEAGSRATGGHWRTMVFTTLALLQLGHALAVRSETHSTLTLAVRTNRWLYAGVGATLAVQLAIVYLGTLQRIFHTAPLSALELVVVFAASSLVFVAVEVEKWLGRRAHGRHLA